jgi:hypothetical protein
VATPVTREQVAAALFSLVDTAVNTVVGLVTSSRRFRPPDQVSPAEMPALYQVQVSEDYERPYEKQIGLPPKRTMHFEIALYIADSQEDTIIPSQQLNDMIGAIENAFESGVDPTSGICSLGGLVKSARIDGRIDYGENLAGDGKSVAVIPIQVIRP